MMRISKALGVLFVIAACGASAVASADSSTGIYNPAGFYIGAGLGWSQIRSDDASYGYPGYYNDYQFAWQGMLGIRPIKYLGLEASYIDFGQPSYHNGYYNINVSGLDSHPTAPAVFAVGYLPIPVPFVDFFAKMGAARLSTNVVTGYVPIPCTVGTCPAAASRQEVTNTKFAWGAGVQSKFPYGLILRGEYERIASSYGDPSALMFSALWQF
jgi:opacity protein-like surface antigen